MTRIEPIKYAWDRHEAKTGIQGILPKKDERDLPPKDLLHLNIARRCTKDLLVDSFRGDRFGEFLFNYLTTR